MAQKPRSIFEDVSTDDKTQIAAAAPGGIDRGGQGARGPIRVWLIVLAAMVALIIVIGGLTRLTDSGLSITEWNPITGTIPPLDAATWQAEFEKYQEIPEFQLQNRDFTMDEFKTIYWWEWGHRLMGRMIGLVWAIGFVGFAVTKRIPTGWSNRLLIIGVLIGIQGAIGWWMVHSGLQSGMLDVASYRLATHLGLAFGILGLITWYILRIERREVDLLQARRLGAPKLFSMSTGLMHFAFLQILLGALVAGIDAGRAFPTWPLMGDGFFPPEPFLITPIWRNFFEDAGLVQFMHRCSGYLLFIFAIVVWNRGRKVANAKTKFAFNAVLAALSLQMVLGIVTVLYSAQLHIAITHQIVAILIWVLILRARFLAQYPIAQSVRGS